MNATTKIDKAGKVQLPKDMLEQLGLQSGQILEIVPSSNGVYLHPQRVLEKSGRSTEEILAELRRINPYKGPPIPVEKLGFPSPEEWQAKR